MHRRWNMLVALVFSFGGIAITTSHSLAQQPGKRVFALLVIDTDTKLAGLDQDEFNMRASLESQLPSGAVSIRVLTGQDVKSAAIVPTIDAIARQMNPRTDTFLFYYSGHGATINGDHTLTLNNNELIPRALIRRKLQTLNSRLTVMLTDCCATKVLLKEAPAKMAPAPQAPGAAGPRIRILEQLLFDHTGLVDLNSSSFDEGSWSTGPEGGLFTTAFARLAFQNDLDALDQHPRDGFVGWDEFFAAVRGETIQLYQQLRLKLLTIKDLDPKERNAVEAQIQQRPYAFSLASRDHGGGNSQELFAANLGIYYELVPIYGIRLTQDARANSAAVQRPLERGDTIVLLDNMPIYGPRDLRNHIARTPTVFINVRTGLAESFVFQLPPRITIGDQDDFAPNFGVAFEPVKLFGARLTRDAAREAAAGQARLERGDMIVLLDGQAIRGHEDVLAHQGTTPTVFVNIRSGQAQSVVLQLPGR